jgi:hypothetical protein
MAGSSSSPSSPRLGLLPSWLTFPVAPEAEQAVAEASFETEDEFNDFLAGCFAGQEVVFAAAENLVVTSKSDGTRIPAGSSALLAMGASGTPNAAAPSTPSCKSG